MSEMAAANSRLFENAALPSGCRDSADSEAFRRNCVERNGIEIPKNYALKLGK
jgi:hypothetical protein